MPKPIYLLAALAACGAADARNEVTKQLVEPAPAVEHADDEIARLRAEGPPALAGLLASWDAMSPGPARDALAAKIDRVAAQRYATASRMYWFTDLGAAKAEATRTGKPILSLRMLGRLDEDLSCANSRYFRIALYANTELSQFLRDNFVLHWSSERAVPRVTIDFGDGRKLERTITGNSAHYVLDAKGRPLDALPGLYAPSVFRRELETSLGLARTLSEHPDERRNELLAKHHTERLNATTKLWRSIAQVTVPQSADDAFQPAALAQIATVTKSGLELPTYRVIDLGVKVGKVSLDDTPAWAQIGLRLLPGTPAVQQPAQKQTARLRSRAGYGAVYKFQGQRLAPAHVLDSASTALLAQLRPLVWSDAPTVLAPDQLGGLVDRFERDILADTAINELEVRLTIRAFLIAHPDRTFEQLNDDVYTYVFHTPRSDTWLGLAPTGVTALPRDGLVATTTSAAPAPATDTRFRPSPRAAAR